MTELLLLLGVARAGGRQRLLRRGRVRARARAREPHRAAARRGQARRGAGAARRSTASTSTCRPASSASRWPRSASASWASPRSRACSRSRSATSSRTASSLAISLAHRLPDHHRAAHHASASRCRRSTRSSTPRARRCACARPLQLVPRRASSPLIWALNTASNAILRVVGVDPRAEFEEVSSLGGPQAADRPQRARRQARPGRGGDALGRLPPARAGGAPGDDADPGGGDRRRLGDRRDGAAPLRRLRPHAPGGDRGRATPTASRASCTSTRWRAG